MLDIPFYVLNFKQDFGRIINYFVDEYNAGRTPNPCVRCNDWLKFGKLADYARQIDADYVATGHYARVGSLPRKAGRDCSGGSITTRTRATSSSSAKPDRLQLADDAPHRRIGKVRASARHRRRARPARLRQARQPGNLLRPRQRLRRFGDPAIARPRASRGDAWIRARQRSRHNAGHQHFTIGQRRALGVARRACRSTSSRKTRQPTPSPSAHAKGCSPTGCDADQTNWLVDPPPAAARRAAAVPGEGPLQQPAGRCDGKRHGAMIRLSVTFDEPQSAVTPGQAVVCYDGEQVLGGGWIGRAIVD